MSRAAETDAEKAKTRPGSAIAGPRATLRVPEVLMALASTRQGRSFADLSETLKLPKSSLHRILKMLEKGSYVLNASGVYRLGPESARLAQMITRNLPAGEFPEVARPHLQALAATTGESIILAVMDESEQDVFYIDVVNSHAPLRVMVPQGNVRPLHSASSGKAILAYQPMEAQERYIATAAFEDFSGETTRREDMAAILEQTRRDGIVYDRNGSFFGASGIAVPCFDAGGVIRCAVSIAGPTDRIERELPTIRQQLIAAGSSISRALGYQGVYPKPA